MNDAVLTTARLRLRPFAPGDVEALHAHWTDPDVRRYLWDGREIARQEAADVVEESLASFPARLLIRHHAWPSDGRMARRQRRLGPVCSGVRTRHS